MKAISLMLATLSYIFAQDNSDIDIRYGPKLPSGKSY